MEDTIHDIVGKKRKRSEDLEEMGEDEEEIIERMNMGNEFERHIIDRIIEKHYINFVKIAESYQAKELEKYRATLKEMKRGIPIIHQAVLHNPTTKEYGCVDLLVRSDYINKLCKMSNNNIHHIFEIKIMIPIFKYRDFSQNKYNNFFID